MNVLVIEDDQEIADFIGEVLGEAGHRVDIAGDGERGLELARSGTFDALIVDRMLPRKDGLTLVQEFRDAGGTSPALFLSALADVEHRVEGLNSGADDYLSKPFAPTELVARVEALGRRKVEEQPVTHLKAGDLEMDLLSR
ncbi:MAG: response regulator transcription factor, partial [Pseudomonadota bacterium]